jgi:hypothetical protein
MRNGTLRPGRKTKTSENIFVASLAWLAAGVMLLSAGAQADTFEFVSYTPPRGWAVQDVREGKSHVRPDGTGAIVFYASRPDVGSAPEAFAAMWRTHVQPAVAVPAPEPQTGRDGDFTVAVGRQQTRAQNAIVTVSLVTITGRGRTLGVVGVARAEEVSHELTAFFDSLRLTPAAADTAPPWERRGGDGRAPESIPIEPGRLVGNQPVGLFYQIDVETSRNVYTRTWLFLPGNRISRAYLHRGGGTFDPSLCSSDTCGTYAIGPGQITVRWDGGSVAQWPFGLSAEGIRLNNSTFRPARPMTATSLVGKWSTANLKWYEFDANGRFTWSGGGGGTYRVQGLTLTLTFHNGDMSLRTLYGASAGEPVGMISVDREAYTRN